MLKKSQISFFILIGIFLLIVFGLFLLVSRQKIITFEVEDNYDPAAIDLYLQECLKQGLYYINDELSIGYIYPIGYPKSIVYFGHIISLFSYNNEDITPSLGYIENYQIRPFVEFQIEKCINNYELSHIVINNLSTKVQILDSKIVTNVSVVLDVNNHNYNNTHFYDIESDYSNMLNIAKNISKLYSEEKLIDLEYFSSFDQYNITAVPYDNSTLIEIIGKDILVFGLE